MIPLFFSLDAANTYRDRFSPGELVTSVNVDGKLAWVVGPKKEKCKLATVRILLGNADIHAIVDCLHGDFNVDCRLDSVEEVDIDEDYAWDCSFFDGEQT